MHAHMRMLGSSVYYVAACSFRTGIAEAEVLWFSNAAYRSALTVYVLNSSFGGDEMGTSIPDSF
jgi:hypothetical protein